MRANQSSRPGKVPVGTPVSPPQHYTSVKIQLAALAVLMSLAAGWFFLLGPGVQFLPASLKTAISPAAPARKAKEAAAKPAVASSPHNTPAVASIAEPQKRTSAPAPHPTEPVSPAKPAETPKVEAPKPAPEAPKPPAVAAATEPPALAPPAKVDPAPAPMPPMPPSKGRKPLTVAADIDRIIHQKLTSSQLSPSSQADDAEFLRRAYLDLNGKVPTYDQAVRFLDSRDPYKRMRLIEELLANPDFGRHFAQYWIDLLVKRDPENNGKLPTAVFRDWLAEQFNKNRGWDKIVFDLLTAKGPEEGNPATFFILANQDNNRPAPNRIVGTAGVLFMGIQMQCAECHVHPITSKWNRKDFWGMAAFFSHVRADREQTGKKSYGPATITEEGNPPAKKDKKKKNKDKQKPPLPGAVIEFPNPNDSKKIDGKAPAKYFESTKPSLPARAPYRQYAATWLTSRRDPYFAPAMVNRMWSYFFALGFVNPIDDMHDGNPASHPDLLKLLAGDFVTSGYDLKHLIRSICNSQTYQRTSRPPSAKDSEDALKLFSRVPVKVMSAEMLLDSVAVVTGHAPDTRPREDQGKGKNKNKGGPVGKPGALGFFDTREYDADPAEFTYGVPQILRMMNSYLGRSSMEAAARVAGSSGGDRKKAIETLYLTVLSRRPREDEVQRMLSFVARQPDVTRGYASVFWALVNSAEFICNR